MRRKFDLDPVSAIFVLAVAVRLGLAAVNREANDPHIEVISMFADTGAFPGPGELVAGYHPKLYHWVCATLIRLLSIGSIPARVVLSQFVNVAAGAATLWYFRTFLRRLELPRRLEFLAFALFALGPDLVGINAQATNDSFVILFSTAAITSTWLLVRDGGRFHLALMVLWTGLAILSKGSGWVVFAAELAILSAAALQGGAPAARRHGTSLLVLAAVILSTAPFIGPYFSHAVEYGTPFVLNVPKDPPPSFLERTIVNRPGVTSIADSYLTFRFLDLLETPYITQDMAWYPLHRTSLWSQLYGRWNSSRFPQYPPSWASTGPVVVALTRALFVFALFPLSLVFLGLGKELAASWGVRRGSKESLIFVVFAAGFVAMILKLTYEYRYFFTMKAIYVYPALLCAIRFFVVGYQAAFAGPDRRDGARRLFDAAIGVLVVLYGLDSILLIAHLA